MDLELDKYYTINESAEFLRKKPATVRKWCRGSLITASPQSNGSWLIEGRVIKEILTGAKIEPVKRVPPVDEVVNNDIEVVEAKKREIIAVARQKAAFAEAAVKDVEELKDKLKAVEYIEFDLQKRRKEIDERELLIAENEASLKLKEEALEDSIGDVNSNIEALNKRAEELDEWQNSLKEKETILNEAQRARKEEIEKKKTIKYQIETYFDECLSHLEKIGNLIIKGGMRKSGNNLWNFIDKNKEERKSLGYDKLFEFVKDSANYSNSIAVKMSRLPKEYDESIWNAIVDELEEIYKLIPDSKPETLPGVMADDGN